MPRRTGGIPVVFQILGGTVAGVLCTVVVAIFEKQFSRGATLSGLNPDGGGPGFVLLLIAGIFGFITRPPVDSILSIAGHAVVGLGYGLLTGAVFYFLLHFMGLPDDIAVQQLVSGVILASLVPRVIAPVLAWAWSETDRSVSSHSRGG